jgi:pre-rRNA-processing protein TSR3
MRSADVYPVPRSIRFLIVQDHKENLKKCSLTPLAGREDLVMVRLGDPSAPDVKYSLPPGIFLSIEGPPLRRDDRDLRPEGWVIAVDSTWIRVSKVLRRLEIPADGSVLRRSLPQEIQSAYPRISKLHRDPSQGLATVEALFAATVILDVPRWDLLRHYHWALPFVESNLEVFRSFAREFFSSRLDLEACLR